MPRRKTAAQLNREIDEALRSRESRVLGSLERERAAVSSDQVSQFTAGFDYVLKDWKAGVTWEQSIDLATTPADKRSFAFTSGARAAGDALGGWLDEARKKAKHFGCSAQQTEDLIEKARSA